MKIKLSELKKIIKKEITRQKSINEVKLVSAPRFEFTSSDAAWRFVRAADGDGEYGYDLPDPVGKNGNLVNIPIFYEHRLNELMKIANEAEKNED